MYFFFFFVVYEIVKVEKRWWVAYVWEGNIFFGVGNEWKRGKLVIFYVSLRGFYEGMAQK